MVTESARLQGVTGVFGIDLILWLYVLLAEFLTEIGQELGIRQFVSGNIPSKLTLLIVL